MSICDSLKEIKEQKFDETAYSKFEDANKLFEKLVQSGLVAKRGYQLLPFQNRAHNDVKINYRKK